MRNFIFMKLAMKKIRGLYKNKASQKFDIPITMIKGNKDIFAEFLCKTVNSVKGYLRYKTIFCHKGALNMQLMNFFI